MGTPIQNPSERPAENSTVLMTLYVLVGIVSFLASFVAYLYIYYLPPLPYELAVHELSEYSGEYAAIYSEPIGAFTLDSDNVTVTDRESASFGIQVSDDAVYRFGYFSPDGKSWSRFVLESGSMHDISGDGLWSSGMHTYSIELTPKDLNMTSYPYSSNAFLVLHTCSRDSIGQWDCHGGWQIRTIKVNVARTDLPPDECGGCEYGESCIKGICIDSAFSGSSIRIEAGESLIVKSEESDHIITLSSIDGDGRSAVIIVDGQLMRISDGHDNYVARDDIRFIVSDITPFEMSNEGRIDITVVSDYTEMGICDNCMFSSSFTVIEAPEPEEKIIYKFVIKKPRKNSPEDENTEDESRPTMKCIPDTCSGLMRVCGSWPDGCNGFIECGSCSDGFSCNNFGQCVEEGCESACSERECGPDECGGSCGDCSEYPDYFDCHDFICEEGECHPDCNDKECGYDGCSGYCGECVNEHGETECDNFICIPVCGDGWADTDSDRTNGCETEILNED
ncbi:MAG: hypothetical protein JW789_02595 [Candidatus Aenigmarchaeota archaeon]|nr:hypothetical protein [Candidatus Aenigmarchaeota archaeon]